MIQTWHEEHIQNLSKQSNQMLLNKWQQVKYSANEDEGVTVTSDESGSTTPPSERTEKHSKNPKQTNKQKTNKQKKSKTLMQVSLLILWPGYSAENLCFFMWEVYSRTIDRGIQRELTDFIKPYFNNKKNRNIQPNHKYSTHNQLLFPLLQVFKAATTCSTDNINAIREFLSDMYQRITIHWLDYCCYSISCGTH